MSTFSWLLRDAWRELRGRPGLTMVGVLSLALAGAANTTVFAIVNSLLLRPLAVRAPDELLSIYRQREAERWVSMSHGEYLDLTAGTRAFSGIAAFTVPGLQASVRFARGEAQTTPVALVTGNYFRVLGLQPLQGRFFDESEDRRGQGVLPVVISEALWHARLAGDRDVLGRRVRVNGRDGVVTGVMPRSFAGTFTALRTDIWVPLSAQPEVMAGVESLDRRDSRFLNLIGRLRAGVTTEQATTELRGLAARMAASHPQTDDGYGFTLTSTTGVPPFITQFINGFLAVMFGVVGMVMLVACSNLAGLLLARSWARSQQLAVRSALGATRTLLVGQLLLEAVLVATGAALIGLVLAKLALYGLLAAVPDLGLPVQFDLSLDVRVLAFTAAALPLTTVLFGLLPALQATRAPLLPLLREASAGATRQGRLRNLLLASQIALSVVLLSSTTLLVRGLRRAAEIDIGFNPQRIALLHLEPTMLGYDSTRSVQLHARLLAQLSGEPGVRGAALALFAPLGSRGDRVPVRFAEQRDTQPIGYNATTPGFFSLLDIPLLSGRDFSARDGISAPGVAIVNSTMARQYWPGGSALGQHITIRRHDWEIIGVVQDIKHGSIGEPARPFLYVPLAQMQRARGAPVDAVLHVRAVSDAPALLPKLMHTISAVDSDIPARATLMTRDMQFSLFPARLAGRIVGACGILAWLLALVGLHASCAYQAARRSREVGIRFALGANPMDITRLVVTQSARAALIGLVLGIPLAVAAGTLLRTLLFGVPATDPLTHGAVGVALLLAVTLAAWLPARRALRSAPLAAIRRGS